MSKPYDLFMRLRKLRDQQEREAKDDYSAKDCEAKNNDEHGDEDNIVGRDNRKCCESYANFKIEKQKHCLQMSSDAEFNRERAKFEAPERDVERTREERDENVKMNNHKREMFTLDSRSIQSLDTKGPKTKIIENGIEVNLKSSGEIRNLVSEKQGQNLYYCSRRMDVPDNNSNSRGKIGNLTLNEYFHLCNINEKKRFLERYPKQYSRCPVCGVYDVMKEEQCPNYDKHYLMKNNQRSR